MANSSQSKKNSEPAIKPLERNLRAPRSSKDFSRYAPKGGKRHYKIVFFETFAAAKAGREEIAKLSQEADQVNVVIRAEGNMDDPELLGIHPRVKVFAGAAWYLIHERRMTDGWYGEAH